RERRSRCEFPWARSASAQITRRHFPPPSRSKAAQRAARNTHRPLRPFRRNEMARKQKPREGRGESILVIDESVESLASTERVLAASGYSVIAVDNAPEGLAILRERPVDLVLVDYFMPVMTGEAFVKELRQFNKLVQVVLQTGYASEQPPREMLRLLDIQGYYDKSEGPDKLLLWTEVGLKAARTLRHL